MSAGCRPRALKQGHGSGRAFHNTGRQRSILAHTHALGDIFKETATSVGRQCPCAWGAHPGRIDNKHCQTGRCVSKQDLLGRLRVEPGRVLPGRQGRSGQPAGSRGEGQAFGSPLSWGGAGFGLPVFGALLCSQAEVPVAARSCYSQGVAEAQRQPERQPTVAERDGCAAAGKLRKPGLHSSRLGAAAKGDGRRAVAAGKQQQRQRRCLRSGGAQRRRAAAGKARKPGARLESQGCTAAGWEGRPAAKGKRQKRSGQPQAQRNGSKLGEEVFEASAAGGEARVEARPAGICQSDSSRARGLFQGSLRIDGAPGLPSGRDPEWPECVFVRKVFVSREACQESVAFSVFQGMPPGPTRSSPDPSGWGPPKPDPNQARTRRGSVQSSSSAWIRQISSFVEPLLCKAQMHR